MNKLPEYLIDKILEFNSPLDIIKCKKINRDFNNVLSKIISNSNSFIYQKYNNDFRIDRLSHWLYLINIENQELIENNIDVYSCILKRSEFRKSDFFKIFNNLRDVYDVSTKTDLGKLFYLLFFSNHNLFTNYKSRVDSYKQEVFFYYIIDIYLKTSKEEYLNYLIEILDILFRNVDNFNNNYGFFLYRVIYSYIHANYLRSNDKKLYSIMMKKLEEYGIMDFIQFIEVDEEFQEDYNEIYSDF